MNLALSAALAALAELEEANDALAARRTSAQYADMIDMGQADYLIRLDNARRNARRILDQNNPRKPK